MRGIAKLCFATPFLNGSSGAIAPRSGTLKSARPEIMLVGTDSICASKSLKLQCLNSLSLLHCLSWFNLDTVKNGNRRQRKNILKHLQGREREKAPVPILAFELRRKR